MKMVITRSGDSLIVDGINVFIYELSDALIHLGHEVYLVSGFTSNIPAGEATSRFEKAVKRLFSVEAVPTHISLSSDLHWKFGYAQLVEESLLFTFKGQRVIKEISPSMVIVNGATAMFCPYFKVIVNHDMEFRFSKYYNRIVYRTFDKVVATSSELKQELTRQLHLPDANIAVLPICIDTSKFSPRAMHDRTHAILHVGPRFDKRPDITIDAFEKIAESDPRLKLFIVGSFDTSLLSRIQKIKKSTRERIILLGRISKEKLAELYSQAKVTCVPSNYRFPVCSPTALESLAAGTPVVGSLSAISQDLLIDGYDGFRVQPNNAAMFASRLQLLLNGEDLWSRMSRNALEVAKRYDKRTVAHDYVSLYKGFES
jgi:glycosyltransferase involved in cell wall biosynthesis